MEFKEIIDGLKNGKTILYPTDTIWGLGCDATNDMACQELLKIKNRPEEKSFIILVDGFPMLQRYIADFPEVCYDLADLAVKPLTIIYPDAKGLADTVLASDKSVGIRITKDPLCLKLIRGLRKPIVSTSANLSNTPSPKSFKEIDEQIKSNVDIIIEERISEIMTTPSQIIKIGKSGDVQIIRK
jgi:L-threonylcarbamoyladenylate synthase